MTISLDDRTDILDSLRLGFSLDVAAKSMGTTAAACRELADVDECWRADLADAERDGATPESAHVAPVEHKPTFAEIAALSALVTREEMVATRGHRVEVVTDMDDGDSARWARLREEFAACGPGQLGSLRWIDARCQQAGLRALDPWFEWHFGDFYASGKRIDRMLGGLRLGKSSSACPVIVNTLTKKHDVDGGTKIVIPIMSARREEADDRFYTLCKILSACGVAPKKEDDKTGLFLGGGFGGEYSAARNALSGGGQIKVTDSQGHDIEIRCMPSRVSGSIGYTSYTVFGDEIDAYPDEAEIKNPSEVIVDGLCERTTTQPEAEIFLFSASYKGPESYHSREIAKGHTMSVYCAYLGTLGAERDTAARHRLAALLRSDDPRLLAIASPDDTSIPAWVGNPKSPIETCYALAKEDIGRMLGRYGARPVENAGKASSDAVPWTEADIAALATMNQALNAEPGRAGSMRADGLLPIPGYDESNMSTVGDGWRGL